MKISQPLNDALTKVEQTRHTANLELGDWPNATRPGMEIAKAQARAALPKAVFEFEKAFSSTVAKVFVNAPKVKAEEFYNLLGKELVLFQPEDLYETLAKDVMPKVGLGGAFGAGAYLRLVEEISGYSRSLKVIPYNNLKEPTGLGISSFEDLVNIVKNTTRAAFGDALNRAYLHAKILEQALNTKFNKEFAVVIIPNTTNEERSFLTETLFPGQPNFSLEIGGEEEVNRSMVSKIYHKVASSLLKLNKNESQNGTQTE